MFVLMMMMESKGSDALLYVCDEGARTPKAFPYVMSMSVIQTNGKQEHMSRRRWAVEQSATANCGCPRQSVSSGARNLAGGQGNLVERVSKWH